MSRLIVTLAPELRWHRLADDGTLSAGNGAPPTGADAVVIAVVPAEAVALHWLDLPDLPPVQAQAAARLALADLVAGPIDQSHVAVATGPAPRAVAVVATAMMQDWLDQLAGMGLEPDHVVPDAMLLPVPADGGLAVLAEPDRWLVRGPALACAAEPALAELIIGARPQQDIALDGRQWVEAAAGLPIDLRQGRFAVKRDWRPPPGQWRRLARIAALAFGFWVSSDFVLWLRALWATEQAETRLVAAARAALPRGATVTVGDAEAQVRARAVRLGAGQGFAAAAAPVLAVIAARPDAALERLDYSAGAGLRLAWAGGDAAAMTGALSAAGVNAQPDGDSGSRVVP